jgi:GNAT superfamily N-acetyltransferase
MITIRQAVGEDAPAIREIFLACYGAAYPLAQYYDLALLTRMIYSGDTLLLVAEDTGGKVLGTASVILEVGAFSDLVGEFGRLAVHPEARHLGVGKLLMQERLRRVQDRLHVGLIEGRVAHPYTLKIAEAQRFAVVGYLPLKFQVEQRESLALMVRYFGDGLELRKNHPRIIPEVYALAHAAMENCGLKPDAVVDEDSAPYPHGHEYQVQELTTDGYLSLLRIERGRVRNREIFGPLSLHYGFFLLQAKQSSYLLAREDGRIAGAVGFTVDPEEKGVRVFELISLHDHVIRFLLAEVERVCRLRWGACYLEVDVSAYAPRMQRTLIELGYQPAAYVPALVFQAVERLDIVKMARLLIPLPAEEAALSPQARVIADIVLRGFVSSSVLPLIAEAVRALPLFAGLNAEQVHRLAGVCTLRNFEPGQTVVAEGGTEAEMFVLLQGEAAVRVGGSVVGRVGGGECLGEMALLTGGGHSATAVASSPLQTAVLAHQALAELVRLRPDIGLIIYRNLAVGIGAKLKRLDLAVAGPG